MPVFRILLLALLLLPAWAWGQQLHFDMRTLEFNNQPLKVRKMYQDAAGFVWLGTAQGLFQYDGLQVKPVFPARTNHPLPPVSAIFQDRHKQLWIGCENGKIYRFRNDSLTAFTPKEPTPSVNILAFEEDGQGNLWLATYGEGLYCYKQNRLYHFNAADGLPDDYVYTLTADKTGNIWAGTDRGIAICRFQGARKLVKTISAAQGLPDNIVTALAICPGKKTIWAGTYSGGFCTIDPETFQITVPAFSANWPHGIISEILPATGTASFIATHGSGLLEFNTAKPTRLILLEPEKTAAFKISDLLTDSEGSVWMAGNGAEIKRANPALRFLPLPASLQSKSILAVLPDARGNVWFSTEEGLFCAQPHPQGYALKPAFTGLPFQQFKVISLYEDARQQLWAGTFGGGLFKLKLQTQTATRFTEKNGLVNDNVLSITGLGNDLWLATLGGASRVKPGSRAGALQFANFNQQDGLGFNYIYQVLADRKKRLWFATDGKGLTKLENGRFTNYSEKAGLQARTVYSLAETADGRIWASTPKNGLYYFNGQRFQNFSTSQGLRDLNISGLQTDHFGNLVVLHQKGLEILDPKTNRLRYLGPESGLTQMGQDLNAVAKDAAGTLWFGAPKVLVAYQPTAANLPAQPQTLLTSLQLFLKPIAAQPNPVFAHDENHLTFEYAGLWYQAPEEVTYRLKLEGYDREWTVSNNRSITYPRLPPGKYTFKVSASASGRFEQAGMVVYPFEVKRPFWNSFWFYGLALLAAGGLLYAFVKNREKRLKKAERLEKDKVMFQFETLKNQVNPHFLFNSFNTLINIIEDDQDAAVAYVENLSDFFRDMLVYREKDTITLREELVLIRNYFFLQQKRYGANLRVEINVPEPAKALLVAPLTLQLLVENAIKHNVVSRDKPLLVEIFTEGLHYLVVRNNLQKKKQPETSTGIGLTNIRNRYALLTRQPVQLTENAMLFEVKIPLISPPAL